MENGKLTPADFDWISPGVQTEEATKRGERVPPVPGQDPPTPLRRTARTGVPEDLSELQDRKPEG